MLLWTLACNVLHEHMQYDPPWLLATQEWNCCIIWHLRVYVLVLDCLPESLQFPQQCMSALIAYPHQHPPLSVFWSLSCGFLLGHSQQGKLQELAFPLEGCLVCWGFSVCPRILLCPGGLTSVDLASWLPAPSSIWPVRSEGRRKWTGTFSSSFRSTKGLSSS